MQRITELDRLNISLWMYFVEISLWNERELDGAEMQYSTSFNMKRQILGEDSNPQPRLLSIHNTSDKPLGHLSI